MTTPPQLMVTKAMSKRTMRMTRCRTIVSWFHVSKCLLPSLSSKLDAEVVAEVEDAALAEEGHSRACEAGFLVDCFIMSCCIVVGRQIRPGAV